MAVDSVNNKNSVLYTGIGAATGAVAGGYFGHTRKPYLENDNFKDEFLKEVHEKTNEKAVNEQLAKLAKQETAIDELADIEAAKNFLAEDANKDLKYTFTEGVEHKIEDVKTALKQQIATAKDEEKGGMKAFKDGLPTLENFKATVAELFEKGNLKEEAKNIEDAAKKNVKEAVEKAISGAKFKSAAIYGAISAAVLGTVGYIASRAGKEA